MPLIHKKNGWYWGQRGPFPTKAKALAVARAAYASGFKEHDSTTQNRLQKDRGLDSLRKEQPNAR